MKILSISPGNGWFSRWVDKKDPKKFMELEVIVFATVEENENTRLVSFSGPIGDEKWCESIPDDVKQNLDNGDEWPWWFVTWVKVRDPKVQDKPDWMF